MSQPLLDAIKSNNITELNKILGLELDPNIYPLHEAVDLDHIDFVQTLLEAGANPNRQDTDGNTPLHIAAINMSVQCAKLLYQYGVDPTIRDNDGKLAHDTAEFQLYLPPIYLPEAVEFFDLLSEYEISYVEE